MFQGGLGVFVERKTMNAGKGGVFLEPAFHKVGVPLRETVPASSLAVLAGLQEEDLGSSPVNESDKVLGSHCAPPHRELMKQAETRNNVKCLLVLPKETYTISPINLFGL